MKRSVSTVLGWLVLMTSAYAQTPVRADFSGTWTFDAEATTASAQTAKMTPGPIFGDQFVAEQNAAVLTLKIAAGTLRVTAVYSLDGAVSRNLSPASGPGASPIEVTSRAHWEYDRLVITSHSESPDATGPMAVDSTRTMWIDNTGRLVIERTGTPAALVPSSRSVYAKQ